MSAYEIINVEQGTPEWHAFRKNHIGASEAPIIMGTSPWKTPFRLWQEKLGLTEGGFTSAAMQRGIDLEPKARAKYMQMTGIEVAPAVLKSKKHPFMSASLDGLSKDGKRIVEIKCAGKEDHALALKGIIPEKYKYQLIQEGVLAEIDQVDYFSYRNDNDCVIVPFFLKDVPDEAEELVEKEKEFWKYMTDAEAPPLAEDDYELIESIEWNLTAGEYLHIRAKLKLYEEEEKRCKERLIAMAGGKNSKGSGVKLAQHSRKGNVDYTKIPELKDVDFEKYRKDSSLYWRIVEEK